ncbi:MAG: cupin domain-containing protein [bacterium]|nr:cupin domain-containing protein [bacterium]
MVEVKIKTEAGENFAVAHLGDWSALHNFGYEHPKANKGFPGKLFLTGQLGLTGMEVSLNVLSPGGAVPFYHRHITNEELYIFIKGTGQFRVDDEIIEIDEGTVIRVATEGERTWRNNSREDLYYIVIQAPEGGFKGGTVEDGEGVKRPVRW